MQSSGAKSFYKCPRGPMGARSLDSSAGDSLSWPLARSLEHSIAQQLDFVTVRSLDRSVCGPLAPCIGQNLFLFG